MPHTIDDLIEELQKDLGPVSEETLHGLAAVMEIFHNLSPAMIAARAVTVPDELRPGTVEAIGVLAATLDKFDPTHDCRTAKLSRRLFKAILEEVGRPLEQVCPVHQTGHKCN